MKGELQVNVCMAQTDGPTCLLHGKGTIKLKYCHFFWFNLIRTMFSKSGSLGDNLDQVQDSSYQIYRKNVDSRKENWYYDFLA